MRFDDSLETVLSADMATPFGIESAWRQLVDLIGRRRASPHPDAIARLWAIRRDVPARVRAASARALEFADPPAAIVRLFAEDDAAIAAPVLRSARLSTADWIDLLPRLTPAMRAVLRHRRDLDTETVRALASFGNVDFVLGADAGAEAEVAPSPAGEAPPTPPQAPLDPDSPFVSLATAANGLPVVAEALKQRDGGHAATPEPAPSGPFQISDLVARIAAYQRDRELARAQHPDKDDAFALSAVAGTGPSAEGFRFETDAAGIVRWVEGVSRAPLIGLSLDLGGQPTGSRVDGVAAGAFRRRASFSNARLLVEGKSDAAGQWRMSGVPAFDPASGRFTGYRGTARRPRADERAEPDQPMSNLPPDSLRQLVHELRTPTTAIAGFAEMIHTQLLGPVAEAYRARAKVIHEQARGLLAAIDDLDLAARIDGRALDLRGGSTALAPLLARVAADLEPLATLRGASIVVDPDMPAIDIIGDERAVERLIGRLLATLVAAGASGEQIDVAAARDGETMAEIVFDRPSGLAAHADDMMLTIDAEREAEAAGGPLLGTGFALRLVRNLATELGGSLSLDANRLTLRLPAAVTHEMGQASTN